MKLKYQIQIFSQILMVISLITLNGCKKLIEVPAPVTGVNGANVYTTDATAIAAVTSTYTLMSAGGLPGFNPVSLAVLPALSSDELAGTGPSVFYLAYYTNNLNSLQYGIEFWNGIYPMVYNVNAAIVGINNSNTLTAVVKHQEPVK